MNDDQAYTATVVAPVITSGVLKKPKPASGIAVGDSVLVAWQAETVVGVVTDDGETHNVSRECVSRAEHEGVCDMRATLWEAVTKYVIDTADALDLYTERLAAVKSLRERGKRCKVCGEWLPVTRFNVQYAETSARGERRHGACVQCRNERRRARYAASIG